MSNTMKDDIKVEVLTTTMGASDFSLIEKMNIQTNAVIANQADSYSYTEKILNHNTCRLITTNTRGASLNRNIAIAHSTCDIVLFTDDDTVLVDGYEEKIIEEFKKNEEIEAIKFFAVSSAPERPLSFKKPEKLAKASLRHIMSSGIHVFAIKRDVLIRGNFRFNEYLGPGRQWSHGEDNIFIKQLMDSKVNVYVSPVQLATINQQESSWFTGYDEHYFFTCGLLYRYLYGHLSILAILRGSYNHYKNTDKSYKIRDLVRFMWNGSIYAKKIKR
ncbi:MULTISPECIES: glycosyltransferase family A protein [unclassified Lactonifactor]|uniref:glycosyltransferase family A protein n=1 Tax=unclassified Lactonifactor TaxID=2636670 RepID=UPI001566D514|nr:MULTISPECIES: glycosyltransferase family A protein [unclassified Lactonifactor]